MNWIDSFAEQHTEEWARECFYTNLSEDLLCAM